MRLRLTASTLRRYTTKTAWTRLSECTGSDYQKVSDAYQWNIDCKLGTNLISLLQAQRGPEFELGTPVDLYTHNLQTATRALSAGEDTDTICAALFHDVSEHLTSKNHGEVPAALLKPYISPKMHWVLSHHEIFQAFYYNSARGCDPNLRDQFRGHEYYDDCVRFCQNYDEPSFDPNYDTKPLETFLPFVNELLSRIPFWWDPTNPKSGL